MVQLEQKKDAGRFSSTYSYLFVMQRQVNKLVS